MAITFPRPLADFIDAMKIANIEWDMDRNDQLSGLGSGQILGAEIAPPLWGGTVSLAPMEYGEYARLRAKIATLDGASNSFYVYGPPQLYPASDPDGSILGASSVTISSVNANNKAIALTGLPAGYVLTEGDLLSFDFGTPTHRAMHMICETVTANGSGVTTQFEVRPHLFPSTIAGIAVTLAKPSARAIIVPGTLQKGSIGQTKVIGTSFQIKQRLR